MNTAKYKEKYGVDKNDPRSFDGLPAPVTNTGRYSHVPLDCAPSTGRLGSILNWIRRK